MGCLIADLVWFQAGRWWGKRVLEIFCRFNSDPHSCSERARTVFARWGLRVLTVAKFIPGLDALMPPLAGLEGASVIEFSIFDGIGSLLWSSAYCFLGYSFADRLDVVANTLNRVSGALILIIAAPFLCYLLWRIAEVIRTMRRLHLRTISPGLLETRLNSGKKIAVLDLLLCENGTGSSAGPGIPGAIRVDPVRLRRSARVHVPEDVDIVLYCSSPKEITSARVAIALRHKGIDRVWVLDGGLKEWMRTRHPTTTELADPNQAATRFGITIAQNS
jgi:rhodanese-related sulfurtransferase